VNRGTKPNHKRTFRPDTTSAEQSANRSAWFLPFVFVLQPTQKWHSQAEMVKSHRSFYIERSPSNLRLTFLLLLLPPPGDNAVNRRGQINRNDFQIQVSGDQNRKYTAVLSTNFPLCSL